MSRKRPELIRRSKALEKTMARFGGKAFELGSNDCVKLARFHLNALGPKNWKIQRDAAGRIVRKKLPSTGHYKTAAEAAKQLKKQGARNLEQLLDKFLERIPPAAMLPGDIAMPPSEPDAPASKLGTIVIMASGRKFIGWHPSVDLLAVLDVSQIDAAWRA